LCHINVSNKIIIIIIIIVIVIVIVAVNFMALNGKMPGYAPDCTSHM